MFKIYVNQQNLMQLYLNLLKSVQFSILSSGAVHLAPNPVPISYELNAALGGCY